MRPIRVVVVVTFSLLTLFTATGCNKGQVDALKAESARITQAVNDAKSVKDTVLDETRAQKQQIISMIQAGNATLQSTIDRITHVEDVLRKDAADPNATPEQRAIADRLSGELAGLRQVRDKVNGELIAMGAKLEEISNATDDRIARLDTEINDGIDRFNTVNAQIQAASDGWGMAEAALVGVGSVFGVGGAVAGVLPWVRRLRAGVAVAQSTATALTQVVRNVSSVVMPDIDPDTKARLKAANIDKGVQGHVKAIVG